MSFIRVEFAREFYLERRSRKMVTKTMKSKSAAFFAILLASAFVASVGLDKAQAQTAGFASSRPGETGKAESGSKRIFKLNPFRNADPPDFVDSSPVVQPIASSSPSRSKQLAAASETKTSGLSARASEKRARVEAPARSAARKASPGAASLLLDELEEIAGAGDPFEDIPYVPTKPIDDELRHKS